MLKCLAQSLDLKLMVGVVIITDQYQGNGHGPVISGKNKSLVLDGKEVYSKCYEDSHLLYNEHKGPQKIIAYHLSGWHNMCNTV